MEGLMLKKWVHLLLLLFLLIAGLYYARPFLVPLAFAGLMAMLFFPVSRWLENRGVHKVVAILLCILVLLLVASAIFGLLYWQVSDVAKDAGRIEKNLVRQLEELRHYISRSFGISEHQQRQFLNSGSYTGLGDTFSRLLLGLGSLVADVVLFLVYLFLFLYSRSHLKKFVLMLLPPGRQKNAAALMSNCSRVAQKYLSGLTAMIACLWVLYAIGFSIVGVENAIFFAILCGLLEIVPFVGNLTGNAITILMVFAQGGSPAMVLGVIVTYFSIQFFQTYVLEPLVVGAGVNINPLFTIAGLVAGELIWGIPGMVLAIPVLGIAKIICDNVEGLNPYGFLLGMEKREKPHGSLEWLKKWFSRSKA
ncbi:AI-2E family transporter [Paraflavisolibacter sp. H34]|uniref:AI-2E family transporter n=1 Tax=Huijunlia imazamoxiresistens TaxID=3127457 RepID=UPI00301A88E2